MTSFAPPQGDPPSIAMLPPARLSVDPAYQRSLDSSASTRLIQSIAETWDWRLCAPLMVSDRGDGGLFVIDGQHRREAAVMRGDIAYLPCTVARYASVADEARLFVAANRRRRAISRMDDFRAAVTAGDEDAVTIDELVQAAGLSIARHANPKALDPGEIGFTTGLKTALRKRGKAIVGAALANIGEAFPDELLVNPGAMFAALVSIHANPPADFNSDAMFRALLATDTAGWSKRARLDVVHSGNARERALRSAILGQYATEQRRAA